ncbi:hypothetical protein A7985_05545 [Pseudoalteromonas luteoviolacea]|uniref:IrrE N-terminal-like domain-containing protein n=1 Tax=Pseudoalteromonas luteoviolacea TaxID=43657 RepID=A0A1C0TVY3_9GAMM|nr:ImmA/IrrE family metallo-endopeptidase [Pseudoalteromonas luteoviolacea]OCQ23404.1 hypothetical protein A7985_05545 [Pseudoalteromonas luteoviolacea]
MAIRTKGIKTSPRNIKQIREKVEKLKSFFKIDLEECVDIIHLIDITLPDKIPDFTLEIKPDCEMEDYAGLTIPSECKIYLKQSVYDKACNGDGQSRFTIAHEIGHLFMHDQPLVLGKQEKYSDHQIWEDTEWQADQFAAEFLMPFNIVKNMSSFRDLMKEFIVSNSAARCRLSKVKGEKD